MAAVRCILSCTVQRTSPASSSKPHIQRMNQIMEHVSHEAQATITSKQDNTTTTQKPFEDKLIAMVYEVHSWRPISHENAVQNLVSAFNTYMRKSNLPETTFYYLAVDSSQTVKEMDLECYFYDRELMTFSLGFMSNAVTFHTMFDYHQEFWFDSQQRARVTIEEDKLTIEFGVSRGRKYIATSPGKIAKTTEVYKLTIDYKYMSPSLLVNSTPNGVDLIFLTTTPLQLWRTQFDVPSIAERNAEKTKWTRACSIVSGSQSANQKAFTRETLGGSNALMLRFSANREVKHIIDSLDYWCNFNVYHSPVNYVPKPKDENLFPDALAISAPSGTATVDKINWMLAAIHSIGYRARYQMKDANIREKFIKHVHRHLNTEDNRRHLLNALSNTYDTIYNDTDRFMHIDRVLQYYLNGPRELNELVMVRQRMIKRLLLTPTRVLYQAPGLMHDNRILRKFDPDSTVLCSFQNDDMSDFNAVVNSEEYVEEAIGSVLRVGVHVAGRHYQFLGCSGSQLRSRGCWLYAMDQNGTTAADIRAWMGELDQIRRPGTYLSRMGQCFSDTTAAPINEAIDITWDDPDIEGGEDPDGKPYCFSDGVGRISDECLREVMVNLPIDEMLPSAFQVRLGGAKGMLTLDPNLKGKQILVRESMHKFKSSITTVEVMRRSQPTPLFLNNQIITILSQLHDGVPEQVFIRFLYNMLHKLADILMDDALALPALAQSGFKCCYSKLYKNDFQFTTDPFFKGVLKAITCARINSLKLKTRIEIPPEYGRAMLGVMDEEGVLKYGEVFVQYSADIAEPQEHAIVLEGDVVVSKMPALHPGDVRKLKAVDKPELHHLVDCIVFPQKGDRPHPDEMAGSDLDGDEYFVTWHPDLIFRGDNEAPMHFPSHKKKEQEGPITVDDMVTFIVEYIMNDKVGTISNAHLATADQETIHSERCKELAEIFCHTIDFGKTGFLPDKVKNLNILPDEYPDFMAKYDKIIYRSDRVLGKLFRINERIEQSVMTIDKDDTDRINAGANWTIDERFLIEGHERFLDDAERLYQIYAGFLDADMNRYGIESEEELVSGCVIKIKGMFSRSDDHKAIFTIQKRLKERMKDVRRLVMEKFDTFLEESGTNEQNKATDEMLFAAACYVVTYRNKRRHRSFPWIFADTLVKILQRTQALGPACPLDQLTNSINDLDRDEIESSFEMNKLEQPEDDNQAGIYHLLINWGRKAKFLRDEDSDTDDNKLLTVEEFALLIDKVVEENDDIVRLIETSYPSGPLLCAILKAMTSQKDDERVDGRFLEVRAVMNMKRQLLLLHHQVARDPRAQTMLIRHQGQRSITIPIHQQKWDKLRQQTAKLRKEYQERYQISIAFRGTKHGGRIRAKGDEDKVFDFVEFWYDKGPK